MQIKGIVNQFKEKDIKIMKIISGIMLGVVSILLFLSIFIYITSPSSEILIVDLDTSFVDIQSILHILLFIGSYVVSMFLPKFMLNITAINKYLKSEVTVGKANKIITDPIQKLIIRLRTTHLCLIGLKIMPAYFGLSILINLSRIGILNNFPIYWVNSLSSVYAIIMIYQNFPNRTYFKNLLISATVTEIEISKIETQK